MKFKTQSHCVYKTRYHIIWIPKYRRKILIEGVSGYLEKTMKGYLSERYPDVHILEQSVQPDHVHLLLEIPPKYSVGTLVGNIKSNTARMMRKKFEYLSRSVQVWSVGYFVSTVGTNENIDKLYIQNQEEQDKGQAELVLENKPRVQR